MRPSSAALSSPSSLGPLVLVLALAIWCSPTPLRVYIAQCLEYVFLLRWRPYVLPYWHIGDWIQYCDVKHVVVEWLKIIVLPGVIMWFVQRHNKFLSYNRDADDDAAEADEEGEERNCCSRRCVKGKVRSCLSGRCLSRGWCGGRSCTDGMLKVITLIAILSALFLAYWTLLVYSQSACLAGINCESELGSVERGLVSQSQRSWWNDTLPLRALVLVIILFEGWRVRMSLRRIFLYLSICCFGNGIGVALATPLFIIHYRQLLRANDMAWWWVRTQRPQHAAGLKDDAAVKAQIEYEPTTPDESRVDVERISASIRSWVGEHGGPSGGGSQKLAEDMLRNPSPVNTRHFPILRAFGLNIHWEIVLLALYAGLCIHGTYVWISWIVQYEKNSCWIWQTQKEALLHPSAFTMAAAPALSFLPLMAFEISLVRFFPTVLDKVSASSVRWKFGSFLAFLLCYYNSVNVAFVLGLVFALRELRLRYLSSILDALNSADVRAGLADPLGPGEQQSVWWSSQAPDAYAGRNKHVVAHHDLVVPVPEKDAAPVSANGGNKKKPGSKKNGAPAPASSSPAPASAAAAGATSIDDRAVGIFVAAGTVFLKAVWFLVQQPFIAFCSILASIGAGICRLYGRWERAWGWSPLPAPVHRQASLGEHVEFVSTVILYWWSLSLWVSLALWSSAQGNTNLSRRDWADLAAFGVAAVLALRDLKEQEDVRAEERPALEAAVASSVRGGSAPAVAESRARLEEEDRQPLLARFVTQHAFCSFLLLVVTMLAFLLVTPAVNNDSPGLDYAFHNVRMSIVNLVWNYRDHGTLMLNVVFVGIVFVCGIVLNFGSSLPLKRANGIPLSFFRNLILLAPLVLTLLFVWPIVVQPCFIQTGREFPTVTDEQLEANILATKQIVWERAHPSDTYDEADRQEAVRAAHPKQHGCVRATFSLPHYIPAKYRHGLFSPEAPSSNTTAQGVKSWQALVRFSNGQFQVPNGHGGWSFPPDATPDIRGMAVKVVLPPDHGARMALSPEEVSAGHTDVNTQDFIGITSDHFFARGPKHLAGLMEAAADADPLLAVPSWIFPSEFSFKAFRTSVEKMIVAIKAVTSIGSMNLDGWRMLNPLRGTYFSATPYRMGRNQSATIHASGNAQAVKFRWTPCAETSEGPNGGKTYSAMAAAAILGDAISRAINTIIRVVTHSHGEGPLPVYHSHTAAGREAQMRKEQPTSFLRINMQNSLHPFDEAGLARPACFNLELQDQGNACTNKIEDASIPWRGVWTPVARLEVPLQLFLDPSALGVCENLSYNPWHALDEHRPLGDINKVRKVAYLASSSLRLELNKQRPLGPVFTGNELPVVTYPAAQALVSSVASSKAPTGPQSAQAKVLFGNPALYAFQEYPAPYSALPKMVVTVPKNETFTEFTQTLIGFDLISSLRAQKYAQPRIRAEFSKLQHYEHIGLGGAEETPFENSNHLPSGRMRRPKIVNEDIWTSDEFFASQFIRGLNPMKIVRVTERTPLTPLLRVLSSAQEARVAKQLAGEGASSLADLATAKRLFWAAYPEIDGLETVADRILYSPVIVFYTTQKKKTLLPLLIQLDSKPSSTEGASSNGTAVSSAVQPELYFPAPWIPFLNENQAQTTEALVWMFAKMHAIHADAQVHQLISHLLETHLVMETTIIATHRAFTNQHPVYRMLTQHFRGTIAINEFGRMTLVSFVDAFVDVYQSIGAVGGQAMMAQRFLSDEYIYMDPLLDQLARRGFEVPAYPGTDFAARSDVHGFLYRDFGVPLWYQYRDYVVSVLQLESRFAASRSEEEKTQAIKDDPELQAWFHELFDSSAGGLPLRRRAHPGSSWDALVVFLTQIIFQATGQHSAVNFPQYEYLSFSPMRPLGLSAGMPRNVSHLSEKFILSTLVANGGVQLAQTTYDILSTCCANTLMGDRSLAGAGLLELEASRTLPAFPLQWARLQDKLEPIEALEDKHNKANNFDYPYLYPSHVPQSIAI